MVPERGEQLAVKSLYVGNLSYQTTEEELGSLFEPWGPVSDVRIVAGRGFGFVDIPEENAGDAIEQTNGKEYQGRTLTVNEARPRESRGGGFGGGRGGFGGGNRGGDRGRGRERRERW
ncbi:MAG: RNA-binding protein [Armatimonadetes bacterium]|nr:RNA-binding protein [Armatimonadota bacterium]